MTIRERIEAVFYSFPVQLFMNQLKNHKAVLFFWVLLSVIVLEYFGTVFGIPYLFLKPEYLGEVSFISMFLLGIGVGAFIASYNIATYILDSYRFFFLGLQRHPFFIYSFNNFLLPVCFLCLYSVCFLNFEMYEKGGFEWSSLWLLGGFYSGVMTFLFVMVIYFLSTNRRARKMKKAAIIPDLGQPKTIIRKARELVNYRYRVDNFLFGPFRVRQVDKTIKADFRTMVRILNQHHGNALLLELILLVVIMILGLSEYNPLFQFPSGMSILLGFSIFLMISAAFAFWFRKIGLLAIGLAIGAYVGLEYTGVFKNRHPAYGMNYQVRPAPYSRENIDKIATEELFNNDVQAGLTTLNRWKSDYTLFHPGVKKPKVIFVCASGGGLRSAYFTMRSLQMLDSVSNGRMMEHTRLMAGASGGMIGQAYFRELSLQKRLHQIDGSIYSHEYSDNVGKDLLNRVSFRIVSGLFLPSMTVTIGDQKYLMDRGYSFDDQLMANLDAFKDRRLGDYAELEQNAIIPTMVLNPVIINDGRSLYISSSPVSYLTRQYNQHEGIKTPPVGIEFRRFFEDQEADSLLFVTALRMNASFPMITPFVQLPSKPEIELIDAGVVDNFGIQTSIKYLYVFREWFEENTSGVLILSIRDSQRETDPTGGGPSSAISSVLSPIGDAYTSFSSSRRMANEDYLNFTDSWYKGDLKFLTMEYQPMDSSGQEASLSWHLTDRECVDIGNALNSPHNQETTRELLEWLGKEE